MPRFGLLVALAHAGTVLHGLHVQHSDIEDRVPDPDQRDDDVRDPEPEHGHAEISHIVLLSARRVHERREEPAAHLILNPKPLRVPLRESISRMILMQGDFNLCKHSITRRFVKNALYL